MSEEERRIIGELYLEMFNPLVSYACSCLENPSQAEELVQEAFRIACLKPGELCCSPNPKGWLINTLKNIIRNFRRSQANGNKLLISYMAAQSKDAAFSEDKLSLEVTYENVADLEEFQLLKEMVVDGRSHLEMAQARGISVAACKKRVQRAKEVLKRRI